MRYGDDRYGGDGDYVLIRRQLTPAQITQIQAGLQSTPAEDAPYPQITADQNNFPLASGFIHLFTTDASRTITGFANVAPGTINVIANRGSQDLVLANNNAGSTNENKILTHTGANITLNPNESALIFYDRISARVRTVGFV